MISKQIEKLENVLWIHRSFDPHSLGLISITNELNNLYLERKRIHETVGVNQRDYQMYPCEGGLTVRIFKSDLNRVKEILEEVRWMV